ncbi:MAG: 2-amino-4-hydroxy-6-hydroxymethyldihydropteridine diphosphokinase [Sphingomonas sp.]|nr:2-amino-4-hydroxy-6-hydroxymethyldihydropteridine diphosphokinase [Sphingomonas sp.]
MGKASRAAAARAIGRTGRNGEELYAVAIGSNRPLSRSLPPHAIVKAALRALDRPPLRLLRSSPIIATRPLGPSARSYANAAALVAAPLSPFVMLDALQAIEHRFRRRRFRRWGDRTLDLDLLLWSGGKVRSRRLTLPHAAFRDRAFVLHPLRSVAPRWRDPVTGLTVRHLAARLEKPKPVDRTGRAL